MASILSDPPIVTVVGGGATGGYLSAILANFGIDVTLVAPDKTANVVERDGIAVTGVDGTTMVARPKSCPVARATQLTGDVLIVCVKGHVTNNIIDDLREPLQKHKAVLTFQNGVVNETLLSGAAGVSHMLSGILYIGAHRTGRTAIELTAPCRAIIGPYIAADSAAHAAAENVAGMLSSAGIEARYDSKIWTEKWQKYLFNCGLNPLTAVTGLSLGQIIRSAAGEQLFDELVSDAMKAARAVGAPLHSDAYERVKATAEKMDISSSMREDLVAGRKMEIDLFTGHVLSVLDEGAAPTSRTFDLILRSLESASQPA